MAWDKDAILQRLRWLYESDQDISFNQLAKKMQSLLSAAIYHFGSYRSAVEKAGIDYQRVSRRPRWSKTTIIRLIKQAKRQGRDLHWSAVIKQGGELARAAFAAIQPRLFGGWDRALQAAGLDADQISPYRSWDRQTIVFELRQRAQNREALNSGAVQQSDPGLHAAAVRHFGSYNAALMSARIDPGKIRRRRQWDKQQVLAAIKAKNRQGDHLSDSAVRRTDPALYGAAVRQFGTFRKARETVGIDLKPAGHATRRVRRSTAAD